MMSTLDEQVARAVFAVTALERALHDAGPWTIAVEGHTFPATRSIEADGVVFHAFLPAGAIPRAGVVRLLCGQVVTGVRPFTAPHGEDVEIEWRMQLLTPQAA